MWGQFQNLDGKTSARCSGLPGLAPGAKPLAGLAQAGQPFLAAHGIELAAGVLPQAAGHFDGIKGFDLGFHG